jgi:multidrug efflux system membrane fusion protein
MIDESSSNRPVARIIGLIISVLIVVGAALSLVTLAYFYFNFPRTDDAYVRANTVGIAPHVSGPLVSLNVVDDQYVKKGDLLFVVDPRPYRYALEKAQAELGLTNLEIKALNDSIRSGEAQKKRLEALAAYDRQYLARIEPLLAPGFVTANDVYNARSRLDADEAAVADAAAQISRARNQLGQLGDINVRRMAARAAADNAALNVSYCEVRAPFNGYVTNLNIAVGQYANEGKDVLTLVDDRTWYVLANFRETFMSRIKPGMKAEVYLPSHPNVRFRGTVQGIGWGLFQSNGATVQGLPQVVPTLNWVRLAQRFPVRIVLDNRDPAHPFRMGATAVVTIQGIL